MASIAQYRGSRPPPYLLRRLINQSRPWYPEGMKPPILDLRCGHLLMLGRRRTLFHLSGIQTVRRHPQPASHFGHVVTLVNHLPGRFDLELFRISFAAQDRLSDCHFFWLKGVL